MVLAGFIVKVLFVATWIIMTFIVIFRDDVHNKYGERVTMTLIIAAGVITCCAIFGVSPVDLIKSWKN